MSLKKKALLVPKMSPLAAAIAMGLGAPMAHAETFTVTNSDSGLGDGTLEQAIADAQSTVGADNIVFDAGVSGTININEQQNITEDLTIDGAGTTGLYIELNDNESEYFDNSDNFDVVGATLTVSNLSVFVDTEGDEKNAAFTVQNGALNLNGVNFYTYVDDASVVQAVNSTIALDNVDVDSFDSSEGDDAVIGLSVTVGESGSLSINNSEFDNNVGNSVIAIENAGGTASLSVTGGTIIENTESFDGVVNVNSAPFAVTEPITNITITDSELYNNYSDEASGGMIVYQDSGTLNVSISGATFDENSIESSSATTASGGALAISSTDATVTLDISGSNFENNFSEDSEDSYTDAGGVALRVDGGSLTTTITDSDFVNNSMADTDDDSAGALGVRVFQASASLSISGGEFDGNYTQDDGSAISLTSDGDSTIDLNISNGRFENNDAEGRGAIHVRSNVGEGNDAGTTSTISITDTFFGDNDSQSGAGSLLVGTWGAYAKMSTTDVTISNSTFEGDTSEENGGSIAFWNGYTTTNVSITDTEFYGGHADNGGAIHLLNSEYKANTTLSISGSSFTSNDADSDGGAISVYAYNEDLEDESSMVAVNIDNSTFDENYAEFGSAINAYLNNRGGLDLNISNSTFSNNFVQGEEDNGTGTVFLKTGDENTVGSLNASISQSLFYDNYAEGPGAAVFALNSSEVDSDDPVDSFMLTIANSTISNNTQANEGGIVNVNAEDEPIDFSFVNNTLVDNFSYEGGSGGVVYLHSGEDLDKAEVTIANNAFKGNGYAIGDEEEWDYDLEEYVPVISASDLSITADVNADFVIENNAFGGITNVGPNEGIVTVILSEVGMNNTIGEDLMLGDLADNGGPTMTHMPMMESPLVDAGNNDLVIGDYDQRGSSRILGPNDENLIVDIGAVEYPVTPQTPPSLGKSNKSGLFGSLGTLILLPLGLLAGLRRRK